ncbi:hypothetical protein MGWOODY_Mmi1207 [hydrothermal vent metagenome]|uniref:Uncharacterized protein n=1 Tax=hydrothermal vent metagenome TaxID=652676 RepID=A0A161K8Q5_9ZZZZ
MVIVAWNLSSENVKIDTFPALLIECVFGDIYGDESGGVLQPVNRARITNKYK